MNLEQTVLVSLLKLGLGKIEKCSCPIEVDWNIILQTVIQHSIGAIVFDGVNSCYEEGITLSLDVNTKLEWIGYVSQQELSYQQQESLIADLARFYHQHKIRMMVLKGWGLSQKYPRPNHRCCSDLDIFLFGEQKKGDKLLSEKLGIKVDNSHHHHSVFLYKGLSVENHYSFLNTYAHLSNRKIEKQLKKLANEAVSVTMPDGTEVWLPSADFNALFLLRHMAAHFAGSAMNLRQVLDWGFMIEKHHDEIDWNSLLLLVKEVNMHQFLGAVNYICYHYLGFGKSLFKYYEDESYGEKVFLDLFNMDNMKPKEKGYTRFIYSRYKKWWGNRWKHKIVYPEGLITTFIVQGFAHLMKPASLHN